MPTVWQIPYQATLKKPSIFDEEDTERKQTGPDM